MTTQAAMSLLSAAGQELLGQLAGEDVGPERALTLSATLRARYPAELVAAALTQQALRVAARSKFSLADRMLFTRAGLEQASSELTAGHAAARFAGAGVVADLCCGIGGNLAALAGAGLDPHGGRRVLGVDADRDALAFARHNASACAPGAEVGVACADVTTLPLRGSGIDAIFIDPARRNERGRLPAGQYVPPLRWCLDLARTVPQVGIKAAPGIARDLVPPGWEAEFVAVGRDLKEALLWSPELAGARRRATVLPSGDTLTGEPDDDEGGPRRAARRADRPVVPLAPPGPFILDPNPAVTRAGLVGELARSLGAVWQLDPMIAFLSAGEPVRTPFARTLRVLESAPWHERRFAGRLRELGIGAVDIRRRGLAGDVAAIHRRLGLRGDGAATLILTRVEDRPWGLICAPA